MAPSEPAPGTSPSTAALRQKQPRSKAQQQQHQQVPPDQPPAPAQSQYTTPSKPKQQMKKDRNRDSEKMPVKDKPSASRGSVSTPKRKTHRPDEIPATSAATNTPAFTPHAMVTPSRQRRASEPFVHHQQQSKVQASTANSSRKSASKNPKQQHQASESLRVEAQQPTSEISTSFTDRLYAGATFQNAPAPSDLPIPVFSSRSSTVTPPQQQASIHSASSNMNVARSWEPPRFVANSETLPVAIQPNNFVQSFQTVPQVHYSQKSPSVPNSAMSLGTDDDGVFVMDSIYPQAHQDDELRLKSQHLMNLLNTAAGTPSPLTTQGYNNSASTLLFRTQMVNPAPSPQLLNFQTQSQHIQSGPMIPGTHENLLQSYPQLPQQSPVHFQQQQQQPVFYKQTIATPIFQASAPQTSTLQHQTIVSTGAGTPNHPPVHRLGEMSQNLKTLLKINH